MTPLDLPGAAPRAPAAAPSGERGRTVAASDSGQARSASKRDFGTLVEDAGEGRPPAPTAPEAGTKPGAPRLRTDLVDAPPIAEVSEDVEAAPDAETTPDTEVTAGAEAGAATEDHYPDAQGPEGPSEAIAARTAPAQNLAAATDRSRDPAEPIRREVDALPPDAPSRARSEPPSVLVPVAAQQLGPATAEKPPGPEAAELDPPQADAESESAGPVAAAPAPASPPAGAPAVAAPQPTVPTPMMPDDLAVAPGSLPGSDWRLTADAPAHGVRLEVTPTSTAQPQAVAGQLTAAIVTAKDRQIEIRLDPPELGRVQIQLDQTETGLRAVVMAERPDTHDLLRRHAELLQRELAGAGFRNVDLGFAAGGQTDARDGAARGTRLHSAAASNSLPVPPTPAPPSRPIAGGLDIRL